jgi:hypothetical protein
MPERRTLSLIPASKVNPKKQSVMQMEEGMEHPAIKVEDGTGVEWLCGSCESVLISGSKPEQIQGMVIRCTCGAYNDATI